MQKVVIRYKAVNQEHPSVLECNVTAQTKVSSLKAAIQERFGIEQAEQVLVYDPQCSMIDSDTVLSSEHRVIKDEDMFSKVLPKGGILTVIKKSSYLPHSFAGSAPSSISYFSKLGIIGKDSQSTPGSSPSKVSPDILSHPSVLERTQGQLEQLIKHLKHGNQVEFKKELQSLYENHVNLNTPISGGWTCLHFACYMGKTALVSSLLEEYGVNPNVISADNWTPIHLACCQGHIDIIKILHHIGGVDINIFVEEHGTPLHCAAKGGKVLIVAYLLLHNADTSIEDSSGKLPVDISTNDKITTMLSKHKSHKESKAKEGKLIGDFSKKLFLKPSFGYKGVVVPAQPPRVTGYILKIGKVFGRKNRRFFELNPIEGTFIKYKTKTDCPKNPIEIYTISEIKGLSRVVSTGSQKYYFVEFTFKRKHKLCFLSTRSADLWYQYIYNAIPYCTFIKNLSNTAYELISTSDIKDYSSELLEKILKEPQQEIEIEDLSPTDTKMEQPIKMEELKSELPPRVAGKSLMQELEEDKEVFSPKIKDGKPVQLSSFQILRKIGAGAFGQIFQVQHKESGLIYAMKSLSKSYLFKSKQLKYALSECKIMKLVDHPFVIKMHYAFQTPKYLHFILDYCAGGDLTMHLNNKQIFDESESRFFIAELILAIEYCHNLNIIYRDLKPDNVLVNSDGHIKLSDFGLAKQLFNQDPPAAMSFCGSPAYLSPEMLLKRGANKPLDIYGLGTILYEMLVGLPPYYDDDMKTMYQNIAYGKLRVPKYISIQARLLLRKILERNPEKRISLENLKKDPFFTGIDWEAVLAKKLTPPIDVQSFEIQYEEDPSDVVIGSNDIEFKDKDYTKENATENRLPKITFAAPL